MSDKYRHLHVEVVRNGYVVFVSDRPLDRGYSQGYASELFVFNNALLLGAWIAENVEAPA